MAESVSATVKSTERIEYKLAASNPTNIFSTSTSSAATVKKNENMDMPALERGYPTEAAAAAASTASYYHAIVHIEVSTTIGREDERDGRNSV